MLFKYILNISVYTILLYISIGILFLNSIGNNFYLYILNFTSTLTYLFLLLLVSHNKIYIKTNALIFIVFVHGLLFVSLYNASFFFHHGNYFAFGACDSLQYHSIARNMAGSSFSNFFSFIPQRWDIDDYGFTVYVGLIYRVINSPLAVNFFNIVFNAVTIFFMYKIGRSFLTKKYAQFAAVVYGASTYSIFFQSSGLKEPLMIFLITGSFYYYYKYTRFNNKNYIFLSVLWCLSIFLFRVPLVYFIIISILFAEFVRLNFFKNLIKFKVNYKILLIIAILVPTTIFLLYSKFYLIARYSSNIILISSTKQSEFGNQGYLFVYLNSIISSFWGPLPTIAAISGKLNLSVLSGSLILRVYLGIFFIIGIWNVRKNQLILPLIIFCILEMGILSIILHSFEVRKCYPHYPFMILISIYGIQSMHMNFDKYSFTRKMMLLYNPAIFCLIFFWNYLRIQ